MYATLSEAADAVEAARRLGGPHSGSGAGGLDLLLEQVQAEAGVWEPAGAERAVNQARGDTARAVTLLRVWAATLPVLGSVSVRWEDRRVTRRISAAVRSVDGGQWLGASQDYEGRLLVWDDEPEHEGPAGPSLQNDGRPAVKGGDDVRAQLANPPAMETPRLHHLAPVAAGLGPAVSLRSPLGGGGVDPASQSLRVPSSRAARLALWSRGETGALVALAAAALTGRREAILTDLTVSQAEVRVTYPPTGESVVVTEVPLVEAEVVLDGDIGRPVLVAGRGASLGRIERRAVALAILDAAANEAAASGLAPATRLDESAVSALVDGLATAGFIEHLKLPHYASFQAFLEQLEERAASPVPTELQHA